MTNQQKLASAFNSLSAAGAALATHSGETPTYVHAKVIVIDARTAHAAVPAGSENFTQTPEDRNRELGVVINDPAIANPVASTLAAGHTGATAWQP